MSNDTTEHDKARQALDLLHRARTPGAPVVLSEIFRRATSILNNHGPCPGFWAEVLAAVRVLSGCECWVEPADHPAASDSRACVVYDQGTGGMTRHTGHTEPDAILAALHAVTKREGAG